MAGPGNGPVDGEDGIGYQDAGLRLSLLVAEAGSRGGVCLGVVQAVFGAETRRHRALRGQCLETRTETPILPKPSFS